MAEPRDKDARRFYRAARERWDDAEFLRDAGRTTAAVYMAGYAVEGVLKALLLAQSPKKERAAVLASFRGGIAHDFDWLRQQYHSYGGPGLPRECLEAFSLVGFWGTNLRYEPGTIPAKEAADFLDAVRVIREWADGRLS